MTINWIDSCQYSHTYIKNITKWVKNNMRGLMPIYGSELKKYEKYALANNTNISMLLSIHSQIKTQLEIYKSRSFDTEIYDIVEKWLSTSSRSKLNNLIIHSKASPDKFIKIISSKFINQLEPNELHDLDKLKSMIKIKNTLSQQESRLFEIDLENYLTELNIKYITEQQLKSSPQYKHFNCTPDILLVNPIDITHNGTNHKIYWIDAKNYILIDTPFLIKSLKQQSKKYTDCFGPGAFVFSLGYDSSISIPSTLILDGCSIKN